MTYRICYDDGLVTGARNREVVQRTEYFTEFEALRRARRLIEGGDHMGSPYMTILAASSRAFYCS
jgi:hypothetical protein